MECLEKSLYEFAGRELYEAAWKANLPIHNAVALSSFFDAFRDMGISVINRDSQKSAIFTLLWNNEPYFCEIGYDKILRGWDSSPRGCPSALYDSICEAFDRMGRRIIEPNERNQWERLRSAKALETKEKMETYIEPWFEKYHEHVLLQFDGKDTSPELKKPELFHEVMKNYPYTLHLNVLMKEGDGCYGSPCAEFLDETDWNSFDDDYHPTDATMTQYFWGYYLEALARKKNYPLTDNNLTDKKKRARMLIAHGAEGFDLARPRKLRK